MDTDNAASLQSIEANIAKYQAMVASEDDKMLRYKVCYMFHVKDQLDDHFMIMLK